jgi:tetratricopeptide (TPR) repeat protein
VKVSLPEAGRAASQDLSFKGIPRGGRKLLMVGVLILATIVAYGSSVRNGFVWDDFDIIVNNTVNRDLSNIPVLFHSVDSTLTGNQTAYYRPLARLTYVFDYQVFGLNSAGYHVENILIHLAAVLLLFLLTRILFNETSLAFVAALIFAVHPVNAEAVNFLSTRNTLLAAVFVLLSFIVYLRAQTTEKTSYLYLASLLFFFGLLCKETALMLIIVLPFYDMTSYSRLREQLKRKTFSLLPFIGAVSIYLLMRAYAVSTLFVKNLGWSQLPRRLAENIYIVPEYLKVILFPLHLNAYYSVPQDYLARGFSLLLAWAAILGIVAVLLRTKRPMTRFGLFWFAVNYIPVSNVVPIPSAPLAERYMYLPAIGLWLIAADQFSVLYARTAFRKAKMIAGACIVVCLAALTFVRNNVWSDNISFYSAMVKANPDSELAHYSLGLAYMQNGEIARAQAEWKRTAKANPNYFNVLGLLGQSYLMGNSWKEAEYYYTMAAQANPGDIDAIYNLAVIEEKLGKPREALFYYEKFLENAPARYDGFIEKARAKVATLKKGQPSPE